MSAGTTIGFVLIGFVVYVFAKGELPKYIQLFKQSGSQGSGETAFESSNGILGSIFNTGGNSGE